MMEKMRYIHFKTNQTRKSSIIQKRRKGLCSLLWLPPCEDLGYLMVDYCFVISAKINSLELACIKLIFCMYLCCCLPFFTADLVLLILFFEVTCCLHSYCYC
ncbi:hypothetical protein AQUCO_00100840v1 [Aquilegia coerulea]|uniref:Uncharacterized protein n=1 Tax=Aquilegia coerulea TaxID=218851 RepID=A0A2G5FC69_AQUCA|nr:hypothetical protein AQUCO_00100840v1 [Aquilegia coerulea]